MLPWFLGPSGQILVDDRSEPERQVGDRVRRRDDLADRKVGDRRQRVRMELQ